MRTFETIKALNMENVFEYQGYTCFLRTIFGGPNGYVLIKKGQTGYDWDEHDNESANSIQDIAVHGGITWDAMYGEGRVIGFDTKHYGDFVYIPQVRTEPNDYEHVWTTEEAKQECKIMVDQLVAGRGEWHSEEE